MKPHPASSFIITQARKLTLYYFTIPQLFIFGLYSSAVELTTATVCSQALVVNCFSGCKPSRRLPPVLSLGPGDHNIWHRYCVNCTGYQYGNKFCSRRPCWCTNVSMVWRRLTCWRTACQPRRTTVGVIYALLPLDYSQFHARRLTTETAVSLLVVRLCGTIYQLHFDWTCRCLSSVHGWKHFSWHKLQRL